jgi:hypothetical protein
VTILAVFTGDGSGQAGERLCGIGSSSGTGGQIICIDVSTNTTLADGGSGLRFNNGKCLVKASNPLDLNFHVAAAQIDQGSQYQSARYFVDSMEVQLFDNLANPTNTLNLPATGNSFTIGTTWINGSIGTADYFSGDVAEILVYNRVLSEEEIETVGYYLAHEYNLASDFSPAMWALSPADGAVDVDKDADLKWGVNPELNPTSFDLYFSNISNKVDPNTPHLNMTPVAIGVPADLSEVIYDIGEMSLLTTYYWRVDVDGVDPNSGLPRTFTGSMKSFTTNSGDPVIVANPAPLTIVQAGSSVVFYVSTENTDSYQWYIVGNETPLSNAGDINGADTATLTINNIELDDEGYYYCVASNAFGNAISDSARLMTKRLTGQWNFDNSLADTVANTVPGAPVHDGSMTDPNYTADGINGTAVQFYDDGRSCLIDNSVDYFNFYPQGFTASLWIKSSQFKQWGMVVSKHDATAGWYIATDVSGIIAFGIRTPTVTRLDTSKSLADGAWHMVTVQYDPVDELYRLYTDGLIDKEVGGLAAGELPLTINPLRIGENNVYTGEGVTALVDDVRVYSSVLTPLEIGLMYTGLSGETICLEIPEFDFTGDCKQNFEDFAVFASSWLECNLVPDCLN